MSTKAKNVWMITCDNCGTSDESQFKPQMLPIIPTDPPIGWFKWAYNTSPQHPNDECVFDLCSVACVQEFVTKNWARRRK